MKIRVITVGRPPAGPIRDAIEEYERRAARYWPLEFTEVKAEPAKSRTPDEVKRLEGARLLERATGTVVALDERGRSLSTDAFAKWVSERRDRAEDVSFVIGGAYGLDDPVRKRASLGTVSQRRLGRVESVGHATPERRFPQRDLMLTAAVGYTFIVMIPSHTHESLLACPARCSGGRAAR